MKGLNSIKGHLVEVEFEDHVLEGPGEKNDDIMVFKVWGRVQSCNEKVIVIKTWELQKGDALMKKKNNEVARILMSTVIKISFLEMVVQPVLGH